MHGTGRVSIYSPSFHLLSYDIYRDINCNVTAWNESLCILKKKCSINLTKQLFFGINQTSILFKLEHTEV